MRDPRQWRLSTGGSFWIMGAVFLASATSSSQGGEDRGKPGGAPSDTAEVEFFEKSIRPLLVGKCQGCHGASKQKGGLRLDSRAAILAGGNSGPAVVPGDPKASPLIEAINYGELAQMPPKSKLPGPEITALTRWVQTGAHWGPDASPVGTTRAASADFGPTLRERSRFWSFQPLHRVVPPETADPRGWVRNPIDRFILNGLNRPGLAPAPEAPRRTLIRRLSFDLIGLPPTFAEVDAFLADNRPDAYERLVDRLLASPHYGERWARHWLDLVRYAETSGHEFDYDIPNASGYRDYVIRALNADVPYDRFVVEHLAGDLLDNPRRHPVERFNESVIATGFYQLGEGTHSPVDVREEEARRVDNQIDVMSKAFVGLTVACARCHDHKFDPIGTRDYYALAGYLRSSRYHQAFIDPPDRIGEPLRRLAAIRREVLAALSEAKRQVPKSPPRYSESPSNRPADELFEDFSGDRYADWFPAGDAFGDRPTASGDVRVDLAGPSAALVPLRPGIAHGGRESDRLQGVLRSRTFTLRHRYIHYLAAGRGGTLNVVIDGFEKIRDPIYGGLTTRVDVGDRPRWITQDVSMWIGQPAYLELADGAVPDYTSGTTHLRDGHGYLAVDEIRMSDGSPPASPRHSLDPAPINLDATVKDLRPARPALADRLEAAVRAYRAAEAAIPEPRLALAITDGTGVDEHVNIRGNPRNPGELVPRRFLEVLGGKSMSTPFASAGGSGSGRGRLELARRVVDPRANPLTPRVLVNRLWKHHFGDGIVRSTDDFGAMGRRPSHPELLDWLATELVARGWSIKAMHRLIVTSSAYRMASVPTGDADRLDPDNTLWHRTLVRRLEAEAIRDTLLSLSGRMNPTMYGAPVPVHLTAFMDGRGRPGHSGPLDGDGRRSVYQSVRRNFLNPMMLAFDSPVPFTCIGRRNASNVPAQALILLNDPLVVQQARQWAGRLAGLPDIDDRQRLNTAFRMAFGRPPTAGESRACLDFLAHSGWPDLCHVLVNMKELIFVD